jgi:hypothetical protein
MPLADELEVAGAGTMADDMARVEGRARCRSCGATEVGTALAWGNEDMGGGGEEREREKRCLKIRAAEAKNR